MIPPTSADPVPHPLWFDAVLRPHRSLGPRGFTLLMLAFGGVSFAAGLLFMTLGAWPVCGFFGLDVLLLWSAIRANNRAGQASERLSLDDRALIVTQTSAKGDQRWFRFEPTWLRVEITTPPDENSPLILASHGRQLAIGAFLTPDERLELAEALRTALAARQAALFGAG